MMRADVVLLPKDLRSEHLDGRVVVVFDVLRATTSMTAALAAGVKEIRIFGDISLAATARTAFEGLAILCGEQNALPPPGFDLGNSPPAFTGERCSGRTAFISTTNGTRAILAAKGAAAILVGALVNASAVARAVAESGLSVTLLCSGTNGQAAMEDLIGCGAVLEALAKLRPVVDDSDVAQIARRLFAAVRHDLPAALRESYGGRNVLGVGLAADIDFAAKLDSLDVVGRVRGDPPVVVCAGQRA
ncbi:MAG TPA: 2-phosphosulfolactate phosphatase [Tepidisphaeraceae bacterium]|jgi:2-phosphosulfolactate phosphatase|nr:2-phosphosulfolactate phosphatase [Tepidisphaeraceae bacterium]